MAMPGARIRLPDGGRRAACGVERLLAPEDVAEVIQRPVRYVRERLLNSGELPAVRFGKRGWRVRRADLDEWLKRKAKGRAHGDRH